MFFGVMSAIINLPIVEQPVVRPAVAAGTPALTACARAAPARHE